MIEHLTPKQWDRMFGKIVAEIAVSNFEPNESPDANLFSLESLLLAGVEVHVGRLQNHSIFMYHINDFTSSYLCQGCKHCKDQPSFKKGDHYCFVVDECKDCFAWEKYEKRTECANCPHQDIEYKGEKQIVSQYCLECLKE